MRAMPDNVLYYGDNLDVLRRHITGVGEASAGDPLGSWRRC